MTSISNLTRPLLRRVNFGAVPGMQAPTRRAWGSARRIQRATHQAPLGIRCPLAFGGHQHCIKTALPEKTEPALSINRSLEHYDSHLRDRLERGFNT